MNWLLKRSLRKLGTSADPRPVFVRDLKKEILGVDSRWTSIQALGWKVPAVGFTMFTMAVSATGVYAYQSDTVLPDHPLYSVRQGIESVERKLAVTPAANVAVKVKQLQRRLHEHELLVQKKKTVSPEPMEGFEESVQKVADENEKLPEPEREKINIVIKKLKHSRKQTIEKEERERSEKSEELEKGEERKSSER